RARVREAAGAGQDRVAELRLADAEHERGGHRVRVGGHHAVADGVAVGQERPAQRDDDLFGVALDGVRRAGVDPAVALVDDADVGRVQDLHRLREAQRDRLLALRDTAAVDPGRRAEQRRVGERRAGGRAEQADGDERAADDTTDAAHTIPLSTPERATESRSESESEDPPAATRRRRYPTTP